jgi:very-short-patch-repair endonuclease
MLVKRRTTLARRLRRDMTAAEKRLWRELRDLGLHHRFRRQHPVGGYNVDFACPAAKLIIELDGGQHASSISTDELRTRVIARRGYRVIRFWNGDVTANLRGVLQVIRSELEITLSAPGGGEGRGEVGGVQAPNRGQTYLTLPVADATGPLPLPPKGRRGHDCT